VTVTAVIAKSDRVLSLAVDPPSFLFDDEAARLNSYRHEQAAKDFLAGRVLVRSLLHKRTGQQISAFRFHIDVTRKPVLRNISLGHFNLSHSHGWIAAAVADHPIGIDIETAEGADWRLIARRIFPPAEAERLTALPEVEGPEVEGRSAFCRSWTYKEAMIKALGQDLDPLPEHPLLLGRALPSWHAAAPPNDGIFTFALPLSHGAGHIAVAAPCPKSTPALLSPETVIGD
jgi:4'-phosphopantetheinyl transferase